MRHLQPLFLAAALVLAAPAQAGKITPAKDRADGAALIGCHSSLLGLITGATACVQVSGSGAHLNDSLALINQLVFSTSPTGCSTASGRTVPTDQRFTVSAVTVSVAVSATPAATRPTRS